MQNGSQVPWWVIICAKIVLSRLPFRYSIWQKVGFFRHGKMDQVAYVEGVFNRHVERAGLSDNLAGKTILELGPGDSVATALLAASHGANSVLIDEDDYAIRDVQFYLDFSQKLRARGVVVPDLSAARSREEVLEICGGKYLCGGLSALRKVADKSVDLIFSQAVLEHVRREQFLETICEFRRVLRSDGVASHRVDLKDHLGGGLNNLRFSHSFWESKLFSQSGFYTNRIRFSEMLTVFREAGFNVEPVALDRWKISPIKRSSLSSDFASVSEDDLLVNGFDVLMR